MAVGDVQRGDRGEGRNQSRRRSPAAARQTVWRTPSTASKSKSGASRRDRGRQVVHLRRRAIREEHRARLRAQLDHVPRAVVLLVHARVLVLLDDAGVVVVQAEAAGDARLHMPAHRQAIDVEAGLVLRARVAPSRAACRSSAGRARRRRRRTVTPWAAGRSRPSTRAESSAGRWPAPGLRPSRRRRRAPPPRGRRTQASGAARETEQETPSGYRNYRLGGEGGIAPFNSQFTIHNSQRRPELHRSFSGSVPIGLRVVNKSAITSYEEGRNCSLTGNCICVSIEHCEF